MSLKLSASLNERSPIGPDMPTGSLPAYEYGFAAQPTPLRGEQRHPGTGRRPDRGQPRPQHGRHPAGRHADMARRHAATTDRRRDLRRMTTNHLVGIVLRPRDDRPGQPVVRPPRHCPSQGPTPGCPSQSCEE